MSNGATHREWVTQLTNLAYRDVDEDFVRFRDDPNDEDVESVVTTVATADESERDAFRTTLGADEVNTLLLYAKRRTLQARRRTSMNLVDDAMEAFALIPAIADVPWDTWVKATLFVARSLGRDLEPVAQRFGALSSVESAERFDVAYEAMRRVESLRQCFIAEVTTTYGTGFVETIVHRDTKSTGAFYSAPRQADDVVLYDPRTNLAQLAANLADAFDATGALHTGAIAQDQLAGMSFDQQIPGGFVETAGCLSFYADHTSDDGSFKVFVAELPPDTDVEALAAGADGDDQAVCFDDNRLIFLLAPPNFGDDDDVEVDLEVHLATARATLQASAAVGWRPRPTVDDPWSNAGNDTERSTKL